MATGSIQGFSPIATATASATTTSVAVTLPANADSILVFNATAATAFVAIGVSTATLANCPVPAGARQLFDSSPYVTSAAVILASGTGAVYFTSGLGTAY
jgi:hypothetical protein